MKRKENRRTVQRKEETREDGEGKCLKGRG